MEKLKKIKKLKRIKELREDNDFTQQYIADLIHINRSNYSAYENGTNAVPLEILIALTKIYKVSSDYILELTDKKQTL